MSCPHGIWHEEDCELCQKDNEIDRLHAELEAHEDMAAIGRALVKAIDTNAYPGWHPADCPSEIVGDLRTLCDELQAELEASQAREAQMREVLSEYAPHYPIPEEQPKTFACHHISETCMNCEGQVRRWKRDLKLVAALALPHGTVALNARIRAERAKERERIAKLYDDKGWAQDAAFIRKLGDE